MTEEDVERFLGNVEKLDDPTKCWRWVGSIDNRGYGKFRVDGKTKFAQDVLWNITYGTIPDDKTVKSVCHNPKCCNHYHLYLYSKNDTRIRKPGLSYGEFENIVRLISEEKTTSQIVELTGTSTSTVNTIRNGNHVYQRDIKDLNTRKRTTHDLK